MGNRSKMVLVFWIFAAAAVLTNFVLLVLSGSFEVFFTINYATLRDAITFLSGITSLFLIPFSPFACLALLAGKQDLEGRPLYGDRSLKVLAASCLVGVGGPWFLIWSVGWLFQYTDYLLGLGSLFLVVPGVGISVILGSQIAAHVDRDYYR